MSLLVKNKPDFIRAESERLFVEEPLGNNDGPEPRRSSVPPPSPSHRRRRPRRNRKKERLNTQLMDAAQTNDLEKCRRLIEDGADVNAVCRDSGATALMVCAAWGNADLIKFLLEKEASPLIRDNEGRTPIHVAAARGEEDALRALLTHKGVSQFVNAIVSKDDHHEDDVRHFDSWIHHHDTLLPNMPKLSPGSTPLHAASQWSNAGCVKLLLEKGADTEIRDSRGLTPLDVAGETVHRADDDQQDDYLSSSNGESTLPSRPKASAFIGASMTHNDMFEVSAESDREKSTTRNVIEEIEATRRLKNIRISRPPSEESLNKLVGEDIEKINEIKEKLRKFEKGYGHEDFFEGRPTLAGIGKIVVTLRAPVRRGYSDEIPENDDSESIHEEGNITPPKVDRIKKRKVKLSKNCLHTAVKEGDERLIKYLLKKKFDYIFQPDEFGRTPAHIAVEMMDLRLLSLLLSKNEVVNVQDSEGRTLLYRSAQRDWINGVDFLLNADADITKQANDGSTVLHVAARKNNSALLDELFTFDDARKVVNEFDKNNQTPLCCAVEESAEPCVKNLLNNGACATVVQPGELSLLHIAAQNGSDKILKLLLDSGAEILINSFSANSEGGMTPLHVSSKEGHADCVSLLIKYNCDIHSTTKTKNKPYFGASPLHLASRYGHSRVVELLISYDTDVVHRRNADHWQPLHVAARFGKTECVRLLLKNGGNLASEVRLQGGYYKTALDIIINFIPQSVEFLHDVFDSFIVTNDHPVTHADCIVTFNYDLFSPCDEDSRKQLAVLDAVINSPKMLLHEVLLLHPLAETFLFLKWKQLRIIFFLLFAVYCVLTLSITVLNLTICTDHFPKIKNCLHFYRMTTIVSLIFLAVQEIFQASRLQRYYWTELESWIKWITFVLAGWLSLPDFRFNENEPICFTNISSVAVLLSWVELLLLLSRLPNWGFNVLMFCRVAQNVLKVLATFAILFFGFMFSFMIEFRENSPFSSFWVSFTKVLVMTSEIEYTDMFQKPPEDTFFWSLVSRCILLSFVILVTIVLMNLMVGMAVNDITLLEAQGRTRRLAKQVSFLSLIEMFVYNGCILNIFPKCLKRAIKKRRKVPLKLNLRTGKPHEHDLKIFPISLRNSIMEKVSNIKKSDDKNNDWKDLNDKIDKLITQQNRQLVGGSLSSLASDDTIKHRNVTLSMLKQLASTLQDVQQDLKKLKETAEPRGTLNLKPKDSVLMKI